jgi:nitrite reductase/ring-hydroxylating ferredoxin subunit
MTTVTISGRRVILTRHNERLIAIDSACPHAAADLSKGSLRSWQLCCHEHDYCFDIRTGRIVWPEDEVYRLRRYQTLEEGGLIKVRLVPAP